MRREEVSKVIKELQQACRRSVYNGNFSAENVVNRHPSSAFRFKRQRVERSSNTTKDRNDENDDESMRTWEKILADAAALLPNMTNKEHGQVSKLASILLLGFLLPHSTGNEFFLLQNQSSLPSFNQTNQQPGGSQHAQSQQQQEQAAGAKTSELPVPNQVFSDHQHQEDQQTANKAIQKAVLDQMSLSERLQRTSQFYNPHECGELHSIVHDPLDLVLDSFLKHALAPFLKNRPAHTQQVDLIHVLAMAIHPHTTEQSIKDVMLKLEDDEEEEEEEAEENGKKKSPSRTKREIKNREKKRKILQQTQLLMTNVAASSFQLQYRHRLLLVQIVTDCLVIPSIHSANKKRKSLEGDTHAASPLFDGAIPHLRASLYAFGLAAMSPYDAHWAQSGLVTVSVQTRKLATLKEEWSRLLHRLVEDKTSYMVDTQARSPTSFSFMIDSTGSWNDVNPQNLASRPQFCPHRARGHLLEKFLSWYCQSRKHAEEGFLQHGLGSLADAIEWLVENWTQSSPDEDDNEDERMDDAEENVSKEEDDAEKGNVENSEEKDSEKDNEDENEKAEDSEHEESKDGDDAENDVEEKGSENENDSDNEEMQEEKGPEAETGDKTEKTEDTGEKEPMDMDDDEKEQPEDSGENGSKDGGDDRNEIMEDVEQKGSKDEQGDGEQEKQETEAIQETTNDPPLVLASLLQTASSLFYYLLPIRASEKNKQGEDDEEEESEESQRRDMLVSCGIQLIHHPDVTVAREASNLLILAFSYGPEDMAEDYAGAVFESTKMALDCAFDDKNSPKFKVQIQGFIATFANKSLSFADAMLSFLLSIEKQEKWKADEDSAKLQALYRLIPLIATASPGAATRHLEKLLELLRSQQDHPAKVHMAAAVLACRNSRFFELPGTESEKVVLDFLESSGEIGWNHYLLARHAMVTGNFCVAKSLFQRMCLCPVSEQSFLWLSMLEKVSSAESLLSEGGAKGIPHAATELRSGLSLLYTSSSMVDSDKTTFAFQTSFINLRLEFLDMLVTIRQLACEMRLTNVGPKKNTRANLHLRNCVQYFDHLAAKYLELYRRHGLFVDQQSRSSIRSLHALSRFLANAMREAFSQAVPETAGATAIKKRALVKGVESHPSIRLIAKLDDAVVKEMSSSEAKVRAAALIGIIDHVLRAPCPFPRDFSCTKPIPRSSICLSGDPDSDHTDSDHIFEEELEVPLGSMVTFNASGSIPAELLERSNLPFFVILLWHTVTPCDRHPKTEEETEGDAKPTATVIKKPIQMATTVDLSPNGSFFVKVQCPLFEIGSYTIHTRLGCRDVRGGEWELPLEESNRMISVRIRFKD